MNLTGGVLQVLAANGAYRPKTNYTIIENDGSDAVAGTFASITSSLAFLTPTVFYNAGDGNDVVLQLERNSAYLCSVAKTKNQCNVATALDQFPTNDALFLAVLNQTAAGARQAFDALSGEIHATVPGVLADDSRYVREAVLGRLVQAGHMGGGDGSVALAAAGPQVASSDGNAMALGYDDKSLRRSAGAFAACLLDARLWRVGQFQRRRQCRGRGSQSRRLRLGNGRASRWAPGAWALSQAPRSPMSASTHGIPRRR